VLAEAAHHLSNDDVGSAISSMNRLEGSYAALAAPWLAQAQVRDNAGRALERLDALVAARLPGAFAPSRGSSDTMPKVLNNHSHN
jgi:hypothetical protein